MEIVVKLFCKRKKMSLTIEDLKKGNMIIFEGIVGSQAYGISTPTSDVDKKGVFVQPLESILGMGYVEQVSDSKNDTTYFEIRRFLELVKTNNPNILELLNLPDDCVTVKHPIYDKVLAMKDQFITKACRGSFAGYAVEQIKKARGLNKKIVNPIAKERKSIIDFCYVISGYNSLSLRKKVEEGNIDIEKCGLAAVPHAEGIYAMFYDESGKYRGIVNPDDTSNDVRLSSIPKGEKPLCLISFNKDGYTKYCKQYREYWSWDEKKNPHRYSDNMKHGKGYDGKNLAHCHRLLDMAIEIASGKGINVRRPNREELLSIRRGEADYETLVADAERKIALSDKLYEECSLPKEVDRKVVDKLLIEIRSEFYFETRGIDLGLKMGIM